MLTDLAIALDISVMKLLSGFGDPIREKYRQGLLNISLEKNEGFARKAFAIKKIGLRLMQSYFFYVMFLFLLIACFCSKACA